MNRDIEKLITLQEKDAIVANVKRKLSDFPKKISAKQSGILAVKQQLEESASDLRKLEVKRASMRLQRRELEEKAIKYKAQLPTIKKNDDYIALNAEIDRIVKTASEIEEEEIGILIDIDTKKDTLTEVENQYTEEILLDTKYLEKLENSDAYILSSMVNNQEAYAYKYYNENNVLYDGRIPSYNVEIIYIYTDEKSRLEKYLYNYYDTGRYEGEEEGYKLYIPKNSIIYS